MTVRGEAGDCPIAFVADDASPPPMAMLSTGTRDLLLVAVEEEGEGGEQWGTPSPDGGAAEEGGADARNEEGYEGPPNASPAATPPCVVEGTATTQSLSASEQLPASSLLSIPPSPATEDPPPLLALLRMGR